MAACAVVDYLGRRDEVALERFSLRIGEVFSERYRADRERHLVSLFRPSAREGLGWRGRAEE
jgi:hypothetical protein